MSNPKPTTHGIDRDSLLRVVEPIVRAHGAELVDVELKPDRGSSVLRLYVEKDGAGAAKMSTRDAAVDLELCAGISRDLSTALDVADLIPHAYHLEVGSPGVERPLRGEGDFARFVGEKIKIKLHREAAAAVEADGKALRVVIGTIESVSDGKVQVVDGKRNHEVALANIESARLVFEFGPRSKPSGKPSGRDTQQRKH